MIRKLMALPCMLALVLACGQGRTDGQDTGAAAGAGSESGALPADTSSAGAAIEDTTADTAVPSSDTALGGGASGSDSANQDVTETPPDQGEPVTPEGDTVGTSGEGATADTTY
jgi:hypothetical protein